MINKKKTKKGFTLVELLAVIVILAVILVIAVPKIMSTIEESRKGSLESTAKLIASQAERKALENQTLGIEEEIKCEDVASLNDIDYESCSIEFDDNTAKVTIVGKGKFDGFYVCSGTKTIATAKEDECTSSDDNVITAASYITSLLSEESTEHNGLQKTSVTNNGTTYDAGIRYVGVTSISTSTATSTATATATSTAADVVKNKVYFNCEPKDSAGVSYGIENYDYASSCETWRIIGVFDVEDGSGNTEKRMKIINTESTFKASWDSSARGTNGGHGVNQWGESTYSNGSAYAGADLMQLLNGYYIGKTGSECKYNNTSGKDGFGQTCTTSSLTNAKMKPLTSNALSMIEDAVWYTYGVHGVDSSNATTAYLQERGITQQYVGNSLCTAGAIYCNDTVNRTTSWTGLVGLMSVSDIIYANGWLYTSGTGVSIAWPITPGAGSSDTQNVWVSYPSSTGDYSACESLGVWPAVYLDSNVQIIGGDGLNTPYKLSL